MAATAAYYEPEVRLDRSSPVPLYHQIASPIEAMILSGQLAPGTRLEDELSMAKRLNVSRPTARRALQILGDHGLLVRRRGVGTQVAPTRVHRPAGLSSIFEDLKEAGRQPSTEVVSYGSSEATPEVAAKLEIEPGQLVTTIRRVRRTAGEPVALLFNLIRRDFAPEPADLERQSLQACLIDMGIYPAMAQQRISARKATVSEARLLHETPAAALLTLERTVFDEAGKVIQYGDHVMRPELFSLDQTLFGR